MALTRWQPFQEMAALRNAMDRLFEESFGRPLRLAETVGVFLPLDLYEEADKYVVEVSLPGVRPEDVEISLRGNALTISGKLPAGEEAKGRTYLLRERASGEFTRTITLPVEVDSDKVEAVSENGVLRLSLPKAPSYQPKRIAIKASR